MSRVTEIRYVGYAVTDLAAERAFYTDNWKLKEVHEADGLVYFAAEGHDELYVVRLRQDAVQRVDVIALAADTHADVDALFAKVRDYGCQIVFEPKQLDHFGGGYGFRFFSKDGLPYEISAGVARGTARALAPREAIPERISHIVMHSPRHHEELAFFIDVLGFKLSDWLGDFMCFLRCNEAHHRIAFLPGPPCLNHVAYDMPNVDEMMRGIARLKRQKIDIRWGPGRHTAGNNTFSYFTTPAGFAIEYTSELEKVDFENHVAQVIAPAPEIMDQWGVGVGGPQTMPHPAPDAALFQPAGV
ncbi:MULTISPECIES: VOC family protein [unclassified Novosphingobium]|uniref:VOC family protein n=1 Tax=unclassified Novosphingobium TaxID=2644732 RepID=UPI0006B9AF18|nr:MULTISPECIES: VOC family protein [unclassified Novosphingobium]KPF90172.1 oxidoreductase [Novosphingobium sp. AAP93]